jgi:hypothetical protein
MIPNFAMDNTVERHIDALAASGERQWQKNGQRLKDWQMRKESVISIPVHKGTNMRLFRKWKENAQERSKASRRGHRIRRSLLDLEEWTANMFSVSDDVYIGAFEDVRMAISSAGTRTSP